MTDHTDTQNQIMLIFESENKFYPTLDKVNPKEPAWIHPVFYAGYENSMFSEEIHYDPKTKKYITDSNSGSWLDVVYDHPEWLYTYDISTVIQFGGKFFHCDTDLLTYLIDASDHDDYESFPVEGITNKDK